MFKIYNDDFRNRINEMSDGSIDLIITDPPYKTTKRGNGGTGGLTTSELGLKGKIFKYNDIKIEEWINELYRVLKEGSHCYIMTNNKNLKEYLNKIEDAGFKIIKVLIWDKGNVITNQFYMDGHEYIIFCRKGKAKRINNCGTKSILNIPNKKTKGDDGKAIHPTEKPVELMKILIENSSNEGDVIFDPFLGVGAAAIASKLSNRKFIGYEIDENYYKKAIERIYKGL